MRVTTARRLAYFIQFCLGSVFGLYINTYLLDLGKAMSQSLGGNADPKLLGVGALFFCFFLEYWLNLVSGALGQIRERWVFVTSFTLRGAFALLVALTTTQLTATPWGAVPGALLAMACFAVAFTLFAGNWMAWLQRQADGYEPRPDNRRFVWNDTCRYAGAVAGATAAVLLPAAPAWPHYLAGAAICFPVALLCLMLPTRAAADQTAGPSPAAASRPVGLIEQLTQTVRRGRQALCGLPVLNRTLTGAAWVYGTYIALEAVVPIVFLSRFPQDASDRTTKERLLVLAVLVGCQFLPAMLGALSIAVVARRRDEGYTTTLPQLRIETAVFGGVCVLPAAASLFSDSVAELWLAGAAVFVARFWQARLAPQYMSFNSGIANRQPGVGNVLLAVGERRNTVAAMLVLALVASSSFVVPAGVQAAAQKAHYLYWAVAAAAAGLVLYALAVLREPALVPEQPLPEEVNA
ncbi:MAG: hypothetical protein U0871_15045 [Gemmataceae bacterium]